MNDFTNTIDIEPVADEKVEIEISPPNQYYIVLHNDDKTPMDFVIRILVELFHHDDQTAMDLTMKIHNEGSGIAGVFSHEIAEQKLADVKFAAKTHGHPLKATMDVA